tara:strand:- start:18903 stop:19121 length:219 start_codon:yes stop_codon:yes gene_type:complete
MITGKLFGGLDVIGEAILLKELPNNEVVILVLELPSPIGAMNMNQPHECKTTSWRVLSADTAQENVLTYVPN